MKKGKFPEKKGPSRTEVSRCVFAALPAPFMEGR